MPWIIEILECSFGYCFRVVLVKFWGHIFAIYLIGICVKLVNSCLRHDCMFCGVFVMLGKYGQVRRLLGVWPAWRYGGDLEFGPFGGGLVGGARRRPSLALDGCGNPWRLIRLVRKF